LLRHFSYYALLMMLWNEFDIAEIEALWLSHIEIWDVHFTSTFSIFSAMARWIAEMLFMLFFAYSTCILLCNRQNIAEYKAYGLMGVPIINPCGAHQPFFLLKQSLMHKLAKQLKLLCFHKSKQTVSSIRKIL